MLWLAEMGVAGGILFVAFVFLIAQTIRRSLRIPQIASIGTGFGAVWIGFGIACAFGTPFGTANHYAGNVLFGVLIGTTLLLGLESAFD